LVSLLTLAAIGNASPPGRELETAGVLALMVGLAHILLGFARLGFLVNYISRPVMVGFMAAAAVIIAASQLRGLTGIDAERGEDFVSIVRHLVDEAGSIHWTTVAIGGAAMAILVVWRRVGRGVPGPLLVAAGATLIVWLADLDRHGVDVVGEIPRGIPGPALDGIGMEVVVDLIPAAIVITLVGYLESITIAKTYAQRLGHRVRPNQEMVAVGLGNASAGLVGGYPVAGSFSRTAADVASGGRTQLSKVVSAIVVILVLVALTPILEPLPAAALAAIIIVAVASLIDLGEIRRTAVSHRRDFAMLTLAFFLTLALGVEVGLVAAVVISLVVLGLRGLTAKVREIPSEPDERFPPGVLGAAVEGPLTFANQRGMRRALARLVEREGAESLRAVVLDLSETTQFDLSAERAIVDLVHDYAEGGLEVHVVCPEGPIRELLQRTGLLVRLGPRVHRDLPGAIVALAP